MLGRGCVYSGAGVLEAPEESESEGPAGLRLRDGASRASGLPLESLTIAGPGLVVDYRS